MARTKAVLGTGARLSDYLSASLLARVYPAAMIGEILDEHDCNSKRIRSLPAVSGKRDLLAAKSHLELWIDRNERLDDVISNELGALGFATNWDASRAIARWGKIRLRPLVVMHGFLQSSWSQSMPAISCC